MEREIKPHDNDILMGRGGKNNQHTGNDQLRALARGQRDNYRLSSKKGKSHISREIVAHVRRMSPPGRFLKKDALTGLWEDVGDDVAREKVSQVLRDAVSALQGSPQGASDEVIQRNMDTISNDHRRSDSAPTVVMSTPPSHSQPQHPSLRRRRDDGYSRRSYSPSRVAYRVHPTSSYSPQRVSSMPPAYYQPPPPPPPPPPPAYSPQRVSSMPPAETIVGSDNIPLSPIRSSAAKKQKRSQPSGAPLLDDLSADMCEDIDLFEGGLLSNNNNRSGAGGGDRDLSSRTF